MANRWKGNFIVATEATSSGTAYTGKANGSWSLNNQIQQKQANLWAKGIGASSAPTIGSVTPSNGAASVAVTAPSDLGGASSVTSYTVTSNPDSIVVTGASSPFNFTGLTNGQAYTYTATATTNLGYTSPSSAASAAIGTSVPAAPTITSVSAGNSQVTVNFNAPSNTGYLPLTGYKVTSSPGAFTATGASSPLTVTGLTNGTSYTFTAQASNLLGYGTSSAASSAAVPTSSAVIAANGQAVRWTTSGFGTDYSSSIAIAGQNLGITMNSAGSLVSFTYASASPYIAVYPWVDSFGTKFANPGTLTSATKINGSAFNPTSTVLAIAYTTAPTLSAYNWSNGFGSKLTDPSSYPAVDTYGTFVSNSVQFNNAGNTVFSVSGGSPYVSAYPWSNGWGTRYANPSTLPPASDGITVNVVGNTVVIGNYASPFIAAYSWSAGWGTKYANPATLPTAWVAGVTFNPAGSVVSGSPNNTTMQIISYAWSNGFGTKYADPASAPGTGYGRDVAFNATGNTIVVSATDACPAYPFSSATGYGTKYTSPASLTGGDVRGIVFTPY